MLIILVFVSKSLYIHVVFKHINMILDNKDRNILNELMENSRQSYRQIAKKVGVSVATVMHKVNRMKKEGVIESFTTKVNYDKLDYDIHVLIDVRISKGRLFEIEGKVAKNNNVYAVYDNTGHFDATILAKFKNRSLMDAFLKKLQTHDFVERTETKLILSTIKDDFIKV